MPRKTVKSELKEVARLMGPDLTPSKMFGLAPSSEAFGRLLWVVGEQQRRIERLEREIDV